MGYANEDYRNDPALLAAAIRMVERELAVLEESLPFLEKIYQNTSSLDSVSIWSLINRTRWYIKFYSGVLEGEKTGISAYAGNVAAFLTEEQAAKVKAGEELTKLPNIAARNRNY
jgi:hypothetical protein